MRCVSGIVREREGRAGRARSVGGLSPAIAAVAALAVAPSWMAAGVASPARASAAMAVGGASFSGFDAVMSQHIGSSLARAQASAAQAVAVPAGARVVEPEGDQAVRVPAPGAATLLVLGSSLALLRSPGRRRKA